MYTDKNNLFHESGLHGISNLPLSKIKTIEIWPFALVKDFLNIGYYSGVIPYRVAYDLKTKSWILKSSIFNKVSQKLH